MKLPLNKTSVEQRLIRLGWKNRPYSNREAHNAPFPRGVWTAPDGGGPHSLAVAVLLTTTPEPNGKPFADCEDIAAARRQERAKLAGERAREREAIAADRAADAAARKAERALWK